LMPSLSDFMGAFDSGSSVARAGDQFSIKCDEGLVPASAFRDSNSLLDKLAGLS
jgi:hypothetical protein